MRLPSFVARRLRPRSPALSSHAPLRCPALPDVPTRWDVMDWRRTTRLRERTAAIAFMVLFMGVLAVSMSLDNIWTAFGLIVVVGLIVPVMIAKKLEQRFARRRGNDLPAGSIVLVLSLCGHLPQGLAYRQKVEAMHRQFVNEDLFRLLAYQDAMRAWVQRDAAFASMSDAECAQRWTEHLAQHAGDAAWWDACRTPASTVARLSGTDNG